MSNELIVYKSRDYNVHKTTSLTLIYDILLYKSFMLLSLGQ